MKSFSIPLISEFSYESALFAHGWIFLSPFSYDDELILSRVDRLNNGRTISYSISKKPNALTINTSDTISSTEKDELKAMIDYMFRLDEDFDEFYQLCRKHRELQDVAKLRAGRLLRSSIFFEDLVKTLCTTNTSWTQTKNMTNQLIGLVGNGAFPSPTEILGFGREKLNQELSLGYRSDYLFDLAIRYDSTNSDLKYSDLKKLSSKEATKTVRSIRGFGEYATNHVLMILGFYDTIPVDCEVKQYLMTEKNLQNVTRKDLDNEYGHWGPWAYLGYKFDRIARKKNYINDV